MTSRFVFNTQGSGTLTLLLFLPLMVMLAFSFAFTGYLIQTKTKLRSLCIIESIRIEKGLVQSEEDLFKLNPLARALRLRLKLAYAELVAAAAAENPAWAAKVELTIRGIKFEQQKLDQTQKLLIQTTRLHLVSQTSWLQNQLTEASQKNNSVWDFYIQSLTTIQLLQKPVMAVVPDSPDTAPVYELASNYSEQQKLVYSWQHIFETRKTAQELIESRHTLEMSCGTTAQKEGGLWKILIGVDKP